MSEDQSPFDLKFLPDWLKEPETPNRYAEFEGERGTRDRGRGHFDHREGRRDDRRRGDRPRRDQRPDPRNRGKGDRRPGQGGGQPQQGWRGQKPRDGREQRPRVEPAPVEVDLAPAEAALAAVIKELKHAHLTHPLFDLARLFLQKPDRYDLVVRTHEGAPPLHQAGENGPVGFDQAAVEREAFVFWRSHFYKEETKDVDPPKGNFSRVARCPLSGVLLGPPNYHAFQPNLRNLYEKRFSRRMSFEDYRRKIEMTDQPELIEQWKQEASRAVFYETLQCEPAVTFDSAAAAEAHFRSVHLPALMRTATEVRVSGRAARQIREPALQESIRRLLDSENRFPARMGRALQHALGKEGLHFFKHRKRIVCMCPVRPARFPFEGEGASPALCAIIRALIDHPGSTRRELAALLLPPEAQHHEGADPKEEDPRLVQLARDLHFLIEAGHILEFPEGRLDAAYPPVADQKDGAKPSSPPPAAVETTTGPEQSVSPSTEESSPAPAETAAPVHLPVDIPVETAENTASPALHTDLLPGNPSQENTSEGTTQPDAGSQPQQ